MAKKALHCPTVLRQLIKANPETGRLFWRARIPRHFERKAYSPERACLAWNGRHAGKEAFTVSDQHGYRNAAIMGRNYKAHRVMWAVVNGVWPEGDIDHINGDPTDNRLANLRAVNHEENMKNQKMRSSNTSGVQGVYWYKKNRNWCVKIGVNGRLLHVGYYDTIEAAKVARAGAEIKYGFHTNHGRAEVVADAY